MDDSLVRISKRLSWALRHHPEQAGLQLDEQGWVPVDSVLTSLGLTRDLLDEVVAGNDKRRFAICRGDDGVDRIRASQGHSRSTGVNLGLAATSPPTWLYHGTPVRNVASIMADGLRPGRRDHVHLSAEVQTAKVVGERRQLTAIVLVVDAGTLAATGHRFYRSANGVWLTDHVPPAYLSRGLPGE